jgi:hypothetical protein
VHTPQAQRLGCVYHRLDNYRREPTKRGVAPNIPPAVKAALIAEYTAGKNMDVPIAFKIRPEFHGSGLSDPQQFSLKLRKAWFVGCWRYRPSLRWRESSAVRMAGPNMAVNIVIRGGIAVRH